MVSIAPTPTEHPRHPVVDAGETPRGHGAVAAKVYRRGPSPPFTFMMNPNQVDLFETDSGPEVLHRLHALPHAPGVGGVRQVTIPKTGEVVGDADAAIAHKARQGWVKIPDSIPVIAFGEQVDSYCRRYEGVAGPFHLSAWERPMDSGGDCIIRRDEKGYHAFLRAVREWAGGIIEEVREARVSAVRLAHGRAVVNGRNSGAQAEVAIVLGRRLEARPSPAAVAPPPEPPVSFPPPPPPAPPPAAPAPSAEVAELRARVDAQGAAITGLGTQLTGIEALLKQTLSAPKPEAAPKPPSSKKAKPEEPTP